MKKLILILLLAVGAAVAFFVFRKPAEDPTRIKLSGNLEITEISAAFKTPGRVVELLVKEGDTIRKGQVLARMETQTLELTKRRDEAGVTAAESALAQLRTDTERARDVLDREGGMRRAEIAQAEAQVRDLEAGSRSQEIAQAQAGLDDAKAQSDQARADWERAQRLFKNEDISRVQYDQAQTRFRSAAAALQNTEQRLALVKEGPRKESVELARAQLTRARAALQLTEANRKELIRKAQEVTLRNADIDRARAQVGVTVTQIGDAELRAAMDGVVLARPTEAGEVVAAGTTIVTLGDIERPWLRGYITESQLGRVKLGQKVKLRTDSFPGRDFEGVVTFISAEAEFTPKQIQTPEERVKLVYRIKVEVANAKHELKNNMPMDAEIVTQ
ncbi:MAG: efflux RND transporter periplasmic adaptor subunit [Bryobacteraceae bacterium]